MYGKISECSRFHLDNVDSENLALLYQGGRIDMVGDGTEEWLADNGASHHTTGSMGGMFDLRHPPAGNEHLVVGNGNVLPVIAVESLKIKFHMTGIFYVPPSEFCVQLTDVYVLGGIPFNLFSLHQVQKKQDILLSATKIHLLNARLRFNRNDRSSLQRATIAFRGIC